MEHTHTLVALAKARQPVLHPEARVAQRQALYQETQSRHLPSFQTLRPICEHFLHTGHKLEIYLLLFSWSR